ncbi:hypothetical protein L596_006891 [Steinernema carpocapsae]|uniref:Uncharacterized protein n=1 Tax=Steinernema carpocapsae TaxID=34508 RepID=A0A4U5P7B3_STECR|nr:hypothetical protein L596_006891 [Steinernema carpocapsae]
MAQCSAVRELSPDLSDPANLPAPDPDFGKKGFPEYSGPKGGYGGGGGFRGRRGRGGYKMVAATASRTAETTEVSRVATASRTAETTEATTAAETASMEPRRLRKPRRLQPPRRRRSEVVRSWTAPRLPQGFLRQPRAFPRLRRTSELRQSSPRSP